MQVASTERPIPVTINRALTELVKGRRQLDSARTSLELSLDLFRRLKGDAVGVPLYALEQVLGQLEEAEATLWETAQ
jgi:hypothetical protein